MDGATEAKTFGARLRRVLHGRRRGRRGARPGGADGRAHRADADRPCNPGERCDRRLRRADSKDWQTARAIVEEMTAGWQIVAGEVPTGSGRSSDAALGELARGSKQDPRRARQAAIDVARWSLDLQLRHRPVAEVDLARFDLWAAQMLVDAAAGTRGGGGRGSSASTTSATGSGRLAEEDLARLNIPPRRAQRRRGRRGSRRGGETSLERSGRPFPGCCRPAAGGRVAGREARARTAGGADRLGAASACGEDEASSPIRPRSRNAVGARLRRGGRRLGGRGAERDVRRRQGQRLGGLQPLRGFVHRGRRRARARGRRDDVDGVPASGRPQSSASSRPLSRV